MRSDKGQASGHPNRLVTPWIALVAGLVVSLALYVLLLKNAEEAGLERFNHEATEASRVIEKRILSHADVLYSARGLFATYPVVSRVQFHDFVMSLDLDRRFPGFDVLNYAAFVRAEDRDRFVESVRRDRSLDPRGYPGFRIKPPGDRPEYYVLVYVEPMKGFEFAMGVDVGANPAAANGPKILTNLQHIARDTGKLTAAGRPIRIRRAGREYVGLAMRLAVYRKDMPLDTVEQRRAAYLGSVGAGFNVEELMMGVLDEPMVRYMHFRLYGAPPRDQPARVPDAERLLYDSGASGASRSPGRSGAGDPDSDFMRIVPLEIAGTPWEIHFSAPKSGFIEPGVKAYPVLVLAGGILSSLLLFGVLNSLASSRIRAIKLAEQMTKDLRETEERFRLIAENASDLIALLDQRGGRVYVNRAYERLFGSRSEMIGSDGFADIHPDDKERARAAFLETAQDGRDSGSEFRFLLPNGDVRYIESHRSAIRDAGGRVANVVEVARDVTERRQKDEALQLREMQLEEAQAIANLGIWVRDLRRNVSTWSAQLYRIFGLDPNRFHPNPEGFLIYVHPEDRERVAKAAEEMLGGTDSLLDIHYRIVRPDATVRTLDTRIYVDRDASGHPVRMVGVCQDVTERRRAEERARAIEERFRTMVENVRDYAIYMLDLRGHVTSWNMGAERINGYKADEVIGKHYSCFFLPEQASRGDPGIQLEFATVQGRYESEGWRVRKDGSNFWAHVIVSPLTDERGIRKGFYEITHDITERKRAEEDLYSYADRLRATSRRLVEVQEAERRLLAGELHDRVGQNLTALGLNVSIVASLLPLEEHPELAARLDDSRALVEGTVDAMRDVMAELRPHALDDYGLPAALRSLAAGFSRRTGIQVAFDGDTLEGTLPKPVDLAMFRIAQEALNNVAKHANAKRVAIAYRRVNGRAMLSVTDDGVGFDAKRTGFGEPGWGLLIMRERAEAVGAEFSLQAGLQRGVEVRVEYHVARGVH